MNKLTEKDLKKLMEELSVKSVKEPVQWVAITGYQGMINFQFAIMGVGFPDVKYWLYQPDKGNCIAYFSLYKKEGNKKVKVIRNKDSTLTYQSLIGTKVIQEFNTGFKPERTDIKKAVKILKDE